MARPACATKCATTPETSSATLTWPRPTPSRSSTVTTPGCGGEPALDDDDDATAGHADAEASDAAGAGTGVEGTDLVEPVRLLANVSPKSRRPCVVSQCVKKRFQSFLRDANNQLDKKRHTTSIHHSEFSLPKKLKKHDFLLKEKLAKVKTGCKWEDWAKHGKK